MAELPFLEEAWLSLPELARYLLTIVGQILVLTVIVILCVAFLTYLALEGVLGAGEALESFDEASEGFRYGLGLVSHSKGVRVKWNVEGQRVTLWSPRGPEFAEVEVLVDGKRMAVMDLHATRQEPSKPIWRSAKLKGPYHAIVLSAVKGRLPVDCLDVEG